MRFQYLTAALLVTAALSTCLAQDPSTAPTEPLIERCVVKFVDDIELPASEAGVLLFLGVKDGAVVALDEEIARIDDREAQLDKKIATTKFNAAVKKYKDDIDLRFAKKASEVARAEYEEKLEAANNENVPGVVTESELREAKLQWEKSVLAIEKSEKDRQIIYDEALVAQAEMNAAEMMIEKRTIRAPFAGEVRRVLRHESEWVNPGDTILQLVRYDVLQVEGQLSLADFDPSEVAGREVTVTVNVGRDREVQATGRVVLVEQQVRFSNKAEYMVRAEIPNQQADGRWVLLPGLPANMQIHLDRPAVNVSRARTAR